jgi:RNA polymerase sigma-70 factor (ECF subfamily)
MNGTTASQRVEETVRRSSRRLVALLAARTRDLAGAEDALAGAVLKALETWTEDVLPRNPEAWLLTVARRDILDAHRHAQVRSSAESTLLALADEASGDDVQAAQFADERIKLMFVCAHPAIEASMHTPLMMQAVLGMEAARMASVFLTTPAAMAQKLVRAKARIRDNALAFEVPAASELPARLPAVLSAIYAAYASGWDALPEEEPGPTLEAQGLELAALLSHSLPDQAEAAGLLALLLYIHARAPARWGPAGDRFVPLHQQDVRLWDAQLLAAADRALQRAASCHVLGRFQIEAAIQQTHVRLRQQGRSSSPELLALYDGLLRFAPTLGARLAHLAALAEEEGAGAAYARLQAEQLEPRLSSHQPYWALKAALLSQLNQPAEARRAYERAMGLSADPRVRAYLQLRLAEQAPLR